MLTVDERSASLVGSLERMRGNRKYERLMRFVDGEVDRRKGISVEGPPLYLWPHASRKAQEWDSDAFQNGWRLVGDVVERVAQADEGKSKLSIDFLVDDVQGRPAGASQEMIVESMLEIGSVVGFLDRFLIRPANDGFNVRRAMQSDIMRGQSPDCSRADARFQAGKFKGLTAIGVRDQSEMGYNLAILVLPAEHYREQQAKMLKVLEEVFGKLQPDLHITTRNVRNLIRRDMVYVWMNKLGEISEVTQPIFDPQTNKYAFKPFKL